MRAVRKGLGSLIGSPCTWRRSVPPVIRCYFEVPMLGKSDLFFRSRFPKTRFLLMPSHEHVIAHAKVPRLSPIWRSPSHRWASSIAFSHWVAVTVSTARKRYAGHSRGLAITAYSGCQLRRPGFPGSDVSHLVFLLVTILGQDSGIPIENHSVRHGSPHRLHALRNPLGAQHRIDRPEEPPHGVVAHDRLHAEQLRNHGIFPQSFNLRKAKTVRELRQDQRLQYIVDRGRIATRSLHWTTRRQLLYNPDVPCINRSRHESSVRSQRVLGQRQPRLPAGRKEAELKFTYQVTLVTLTQCLHDPLSSLLAASPFPINRGI